MKTMSALELVDDLIAELEGRLNLKPGEAPRGAGSASASATSTTNKKPPANNNKKAGKKKSKPPPPQGGGAKGAQAAPANNGGDDDDNQQPEICKLEFKVGVIQKVWVHPTADKLYCEEIDVNEADGPRLIASGLRPHFGEEQMLHQRVLVVSNLKAKNLVGFKSHGMVLCAAATLEDGKERVEFVEPPDGAAVGEVISFDGLPLPHPVSAAQVEKKKVFQNCMPAMRTTDDCVAAWDGHAFVTSAGPCRVKSLANASLR
jgi:aminoacyl tRNA synthase complex-interacting multifunctional protein 1